MNLYANKGMFLETLINKTAQYYFEQQVCFIQKRTTPLKIYKVKNKDVEAKLDTNAMCDYYGSYHGHHFEFEAKQTQLDSLSLNNLKAHQYDHLKTMDILMIHAFIIIHFIKFDDYFIVNIKQLDEFIKTSKTKNISHDWCNNNAYKISLVFPGILDFASYFKKIYKD